LSNPFSSVVQSPLGPAQWGQSPADATEAHTSHTIDVILRFTLFSLIGIRDGDATAEPHGGANSQLPK
jgi:hypothetical protein